MPILTLPHFSLLSGHRLSPCHVSYTTHGTLSSSGENCILVCHALTGSSDVADWWGPLIGAGKVLDAGKWFVVCVGVLGSPYGTSSPVSAVSVQSSSLSSGSPPLLETLMDKSSISSPLATTVSADNASNSSPPATTAPSNNASNLSIPATAAPSDNASKSSPPAATPPSGTSPSPIATTDQANQGDRYGPDFPPTCIRDDVRLQRALLGHLNVRRVQCVIGGSMGGMQVLEWAALFPSFVRCIIPIATSSCHSAWCISWSEAQRQSIFSDPAYRNGRYAADAPPVAGLAAARMTALLTYRSAESFHSRFGRASVSSPECRTPEQSHNEGGDVFHAQSYLRYQAKKFNDRFDANCYIHLTRKMDAHDISRGRYIVDGKITEIASESGQKQATINQVLAAITAQTLVVSVESDGLFSPPEQRRLADNIPSAEFVTLSSPDGHDGFLPEFAALNKCVVDFLRRKLPEFYPEPLEDLGQGAFVADKNSKVGEAESQVFDHGVARW